MIHNTAAIFGQAGRPERPQGPPQAPRRDDTEDGAMTATMQAIDLTAVSAGLLVGRLVLGLAMAGHGSQKLFGWFGGYGLTGTGGYLEQLGFRPGRVYAAAAAGTEVVSGLLVALGLLGPVGPALMLS